MNNESFDPGEVRELQRRLADVINRLARIEDHFGFARTDVDPPAPADLKTTTVNKTTVVAGSVPPVVDPSMTREVSDGEIILAELRETAVSSSPPTATSPESQIQPANQGKVLRGESLESLIGGRVFTWVGGILLILAAAFFVVWSWRHLNVPPWGKVVFIHGLGLATLYAGSSLKRRQLEIHSRAFYGIGVFILYASALAMTHLYMIGGEYRELYGFIDGILITALAIGLSLRNQSVGIILLGAFGGYVTPLVTIHGAGDEGVMFTYLALLNIALVVCSQLGKWDFLKPLAWTFTAFIFFVALVSNSFESASMATTMLTLHGLIFLGVVTAPLYLQRPSDSPGLVVLVLNSLAFLAAYGLIHDFSLNHLTIMSVILASLHGLLTWVAFSRLSFADRSGRTHLALASLFATLALTFTFNESREYLVYVWALEGLAFGVIGIAFRDRQLLVTSGLAFSLTLIRAIVVDFADPLAVTAATLDPRAIRWVLIATLMSLTASSYGWIPRPGNRHADNKDRVQAAETIIRFFAQGMLAIANLVFLAAMFFQFHNNLPVLLLVVATDVACLWICSFAMLEKSIRDYAMVLGSGLAVFAGALMVSQFRLQGVQWDFWCRLAFPLTAMMFLASGYAYWLTCNCSNRFNDDDWDKQVHGWFSISGHLLLLAVLTMEISLFFGVDGSISIGEMATYSVAWGVYAASMVAFGFLLKYPAIRFMGIGLFGLVLCKVFLADLVQFDLIVRVIALLILGLLLLGVSLLYQKFRMRIDSAFRDSS